MQTSVQTAAVRRWATEVVIGAHRLQLSVRGTCMGAVVPEGAHVCVRRRTLYWPGDVVAVACPEDAVVRVHRLLAIVPSRSGARVLTRGDGTDRRDRSAPHTRLLGRVAHVDGQPLRIPVRARWTALRVLARELVDRLAGARRHVAANSLRH